MNVNFSLPILRSTLPLVLYLFEYIRRALNSLCLEGIIQTPKVLALTLPVKTPCSIKIQVAGLYERKNHSIIQSSGYASRTLLTNMWLASSHRLK